MREGPRPRSTPTDTTGELVLDPTHPPATAFGFLVEALARRRAAGIAPPTVLSCDNPPGNGALARRVIVAFARLRDASTADWMAEHVRFPSSMVDRITPATRAIDVEDVARTWGFEDSWPVVCEPITRWVVEDDLGPGHPALERVGVQLVPDVHSFDLAKLRMLNAGHQLLGHVGLALDLIRVHGAVADDDLRALLLDYLRDDAAPTLVAAADLDPEEYAASLLPRFQRWPRRHVAERFNVSVTTVRRWADRYREHGSAGMADRSSRPLVSSPHTHQDRATGPGTAGLTAMGPNTHRLPPRAAALHAAQDPAPLRLPAAGLDRPGHRVRVRGPQGSRRVVRRYKHDAPGDLVHVDTKKLGRIPDDSRRRSGRVFGAASPGRGC